ncbi:MAG: two-component sensor histidine kinase, partial [Amaricoccus sp.]
MGGLIGFWREQTLLRRFVFAGGVVMLAAMLLVGTWVTGRIERAVIGNTAAATALYMESFISPLSQELARENSLSEPANRALTEVFSGTPLGQRIVSYKIWKPGGYVVAASDPGIVGKTLTPSGAQRAAWRGEVTANFEGLHEAENAPEAAMGLPLLEIYSPVREVWTGDVIAVVEFYAVEDTLISDVARARRQSWLFIAAVFAGCGLLLVGIVRGGGRTIERQKAMLREEARRSNAIAAQNAELRQRAVGAAARAAA